MVGSIVGPSNFKGAILQRLTIQKLASQVRATRQQLKELLQHYNEPAGLPPDIATSLKGKIELLFDNLIDLDDEFAFPAAEISLEEREGIVHLNSELAYVESRLSDVLALALELEAKEAEEEQRRRANDKEKFNAGTLKIIHEELGSLQNSLFDLIDRSGFDKASARSLKRTVEAEFAYLKKSSTKLGIKEWKGVLITTVISLIILFGTNAEAREMVGESARVVLIAVDPGYAADVNAPAPILGDGLTPAASPRGDDRKGKE